MAINYLGQPAADEFELSLFGPGFGEAAALHVGEQNWLLIDSCIEPESRRPASLHYLQQIGISPQQVRTVLASHWHDDHVRGLSELVKSCSVAELALSDVFNDQEAFSFLTAYAGAVAPDQTRGAKELYGALTSVFATGRKLIWSGERTQLFGRTILGHAIRVDAFSPTMHAKTQFKARSTSLRAAKNKPIPHAPELRPNLEAVVVHVDLPGGAILLGSDLECHATAGWDALVGDQHCCAQAKASVYKVAHHGSVTGDHKGIWQQFLIPRPIAVLTPFVRGSVRLPTDDDETRIRSLSSQAHISSGASRRPSIPAATLRRMQSVCSGIVRRNPGFGAIRLRRRMGEGAWRVERFGDAAAL